MCSRDLEGLKSVWDVAQLVHFNFLDWRTTLWDAIDVELYMNEAKKLKELLRKLDKRVRSWDAYKGLDEDIGNMMVVLPLIQQLKQPSMRQRHWKELMEVTGVQFTMDSNFCMADLINLNLHLYEEDVESVVIKSSKELGIEKNLARIEESWKKIEINPLPLLLLVLMILAYGITYIHYPKGLSIIYTD